MISLIGLVVYYFWWVVEIKIVKIVNGDFKGVILLLLIIYVSGFVIIFYFFV